MARSFACHSYLHKLSFCNPGGMHVSPFEVPVALLTLTHSVPPPQSAPGFFGGLKSSQSTRQKQLPARSVSSNQR
jgi:hypothetical protein